MTQRFLVPVALLAAGLLVVSFSSVQAGGKKSDSEVKVTAKITPPDSKGNQKLTITLAHKDGWHTYANPVGNEDFDSNKTVITLKANGKPIVAKIEYPEGKTTKDKVVGDYKVYEKKIDIQAALQRVPGDNSPLEIAVRVQACSEKGVCLLPATVKLTVP